VNHLPGTPQNSRFLHNFSSLSNCIEITCLAVACIGVALVYRLRLSKAFRHFQIANAQSITVARLPTMLLSILLASATTAAASTIHKRSNLLTDNSTDTIVNLGSCGSYQGISQNNGTYA